MREIKFKGKTLNSKKWIYGGYCKDASGYDCILLPIKGGHIFEPVIPESVEQYTGFKDKYEKESYGKNILEDSVAGTKVIIEWCNFAYAWTTHQIDNNKIEMLSAWNPKNLEIIGNIYSDSELMEEKK